MAALRAAMAARRLVEMVASEDLAALAATAASWWTHRRLVATAALPVLAERAALAATELEVTAATAVTAVTAATRMAATRLVAMAATDFRSLQPRRSLNRKYGIAERRRAEMAGARVGATVT